MVKVHVNSSYYKPWGMVEVQLSFSKLGARWGRVVNATGLNGHKPQITASNSESRVGFGIEL